MEMAVRIENFVHWIFYSVRPAGGHMESKCGFAKRFRSPIRTMESAKQSILIFLVCLIDIELSLYYN